MYKGYNKAETTALIILTIPVLILNCVEFVLITRKRKQINCHQRILRSLAIADFLVAVALLIGNSNHLVMLTQDTEGESGLIKAVEAGIWFSIISSVLHVLCLTVDRAIAVHHPLKHRVWVNRKRTNISIACIWVLSPVVVTLSIFLIDVPTTKIIFSYLGVCFSIIIIIVYVVMVKKVLIDRRKFIKTQSGASASSNTAVAQGRRRNMEYRLAITCMVIVLAFVVSVIPYAAMQIITRGEVIYSCMLLLGNSLMNPLIFLWTYYRSEQRRQ